MNEPSGPVIHIGVSAVLAILFRLNPVITVFCGVLPDLIDKPLAVLGIGGGRYIGHTLLIAVLVVAAFFLWKRRYGLAALTGLMSHLLLDLNALVPWFYPFRKYNFNSTKLDIVDWAKDYLHFSRSGYELIIIALVGLAAFICRWLYQWYTRRRKRKGSQH